MNCEEQQIRPTLVEKPKESGITTENVSNQVVSSLKIGGEIPFGRYPQGANGEVEPLIWRVLADECVAACVDMISASRLCSDFVDLSSPHFLRYI